MDNVQDCDSYTYELDVSLFLFTSAYFSASHCTVFVLCFASPKLKRRLISPTVSALSRCFCIHDCNETRLGSFTHTVFLLSQHFVEVKTLQKPVTGCWWSLVCRNSLKEHDEWSVFREKISFCSVSTRSRKRDYGRRGSAALTMRHLSIRKSWH
jgi:hypothetical protein